MNDPIAVHPDKINDIQQVYGLVKAGHGLPMPFTGPDRATFWFTAITHAEAGRRALYDAELLFAGAFGAVFTPRREQMSNGLRYIYEALLPSGLTIALAVRAEHVEGYDPRLPAGSARELVAA